MSFLLTSLLNEEVLHLKEEVETPSETVNQDNSNGLENFHINEDETPHLFNSEDSNNEENEYT